VVLFAVDAFEVMWTRLVLFGFELGRIYFKVNLAAPGVVRLTLVTGIKPTVPLSVIDKENSLGVLAVLYPTYIQECLFIVICLCA